MHPSRFAAGALITAGGMVALAIAPPASTMLASSTAPRAVSDGILPTSPTDGGLRRVDPARPPGDWLSSLWKISFHLEDIADVQSLEGMNRRTTHFRGMTYSVGPFPDMFVTPTGIQGEFNERLEVPDRTVDQVWRSAGAPALPASIDDDRRHELLVGRHVKACSDYISVQTDGSRNVAGTPNTFVLSNNFRWKASITQTIHKSPPVHITTDLVDAQPLYTATEAEVPYNYRELVNRGAVDVPFYSGAPGNGVVGPYRKIKRLISFRITRMPMDLELLPQCRPGLSPPHCVGNLMGTAYLNCPGQECSKPSDYLGIDAQGDHYIHSNVDVRLHIGGEDVTRFMMEVPGRSKKYFAIARRRRAWDDSLGRNDQPVGRPKLQTRDGPNGWIDDETGIPGSGRVTEPNWYDLPGLRFTGRPASWPRLRMLQEFLVGVKKFPEFGFLYFVVAVDVKPGEYRVQKSTGKHITADEWCNIERTSRMYANAPAFTDDSGWQRSP